MNLHIKLTVRGRFGRSPRGNEGSRTRCQALARATLSGETSRQAGDPATHHEGAVKCLCCESLPLDVFLVLVPRALPQRPRESRNECREDPDRPDRFSGFARLGGWLGMGFIVLLDAFRGNLSGLTSRKPAEEAGSRPAIQG